MAYMVIEEQTDSILHLKRSPGIRSWSVLVGIGSIGLAAAYYSTDNLGWKLFYVVGCLFVAVQNLEDWEEVIFDKNKGNAVLKNFNLYTRILTMWNKSQEQVVAQLQHIRAVTVEEERVRYLGKGYLVVLRFATGFSHPITQSAVLSNRSDVAAVAQLITNFLNLNKPSVEDKMGLSLDSSDGTGSDNEKN
ncbi:cytochrome b-245 chaperone 1 [Stegostoma tigrinum]|uniref:cytochrome b-245 chaperone 1 n=1 Tax=Stegostoma tigrinum TaxID=3053191 RepID=UPI00202B876E|nr:cytochrome b-245 chaperone 1 [Stegostoma tigrinum]XP_048410934.1 cytochrome b-245 chaperone 1 [Stegostoma tigrinum]XP_048410935.1 cytochrome b-245 chaperone 1 [Stegostoma tigrinum]